METENSTIKRKHTVELDLKEETESGSEGERESGVLPVKDKIKRKQHDNKEIVLLTIDPPTGRSAYKSNISGNNHPVTSNDKSMEKMDTLSSSGIIQESTQHDLQLEKQEGKESVKQQEQLIPEYKSSAVYILLMAILLRIIATINANCIREKLKQIMLRDFLVHSDIDILLLQEVNTDNLSFLAPI
ncbi:hypothetical protein ANN_11278 [Periplaneta americana]|uniref:Uncharacterized protein n=1 Tax=Periplaneta americana TaxID=6978 RepID=A0ABQ8T651_PERAM|nr:hypothetical protein ANN_11278 [Periplaneta americana]